MAADGLLGEQRDEDPEGHRLAELRRQLSSLARNPKRRYSEWTADTPCSWRPLEVLSPESGLPFSNSGAWEFIAHCLDEGWPMTEIILEKPPGQRAYVITPHLGSRRLYIKLQLRNGRLLGRSFHYSEVSRD